MKTCSDVQYITELEQFYLAIGQLRRYLKRFIDIIHIRASTFTALVFFRREKNQRISIGKLRALSNTNRDSESGVPGQFRSMRLQWEELACACQSRGARAQSEKTIFRTVLQYSGVSRGIRVRYSTIRAMQFSDELHRVHTVASRDFMQPADGARVGGARLPRNVSLARD